jgi:hypothetical protein
MTTVEWYVSERRWDRIAFAHMVHTWCFDRLPVRGPDFTYRLVPAPVTVDRQRYIPGLS